MVFLFSHHFSILRTSSTPAPQNPLNRTPSDFIQFSYTSLYKTYKSELGASNSSFGDSCDPQIWPPDLIHHTLNLSKTCGFLHFLIISNPKDTLNLSKTNVFYLFFFHLPRLISTPSARPPKSSKSDPL